MNEQLHWKVKSYLFLSSSINSWIQLLAVVPSCLSMSKWKSFLFSERNRDEVIHTSYIFVLYIFPTQENGLLKIMVGSHSNWLDLLSPAKVFLIPGGCSAQWVPGDSVSHWRIWYLKNTKHPKHIQIKWRQGARRRERVRGSKGTDFQL